MKNCESRCTSRQLLTFFLPSDVKIVDGANGRPAYKGGLDPALPKGDGRIAIRENGRLEEIGAALNQRIGRE